MLVLFLPARTVRAGRLRQMRDRALRRPGWQVEPAGVLGLKAQAITLLLYEGMRPGAVERRLDALAADLMENGLSRAVFHRDFSYRRALLERGLREPDETELLRKMAPQVVSALAREGETAFLYARQPDRETVPALEAMCAHYRYVLAEFESGGGSVTARVSRRLGVSIQERPSPKQLLRADVAVFFSPPPGLLTLGPQCVAVFPSGVARAQVRYHRAADQITYALKGRQIMPEGYPAAQLLTAALSAGTISSEELSVLSVMSMKEES